MFLNDSSNSIVMILLTLIGVLDQFDIELAIWAFGVVLLVLDKENGTFGYIGWQS